MSDQKREPLTPDALRAWVEARRASKYALMHKATQRFGAVVEFFDGVEKVHRSPINGAITECPVVGLSSGDEFAICEGEHPEDVFRVLTPSEARFYVMTTEAVASVVGELAIHGATLKIGEDIGVPLIAAVLRQQATTIAGVPAGEEAS